MLTTLDLAEKEGWFRTLSGTLVPHTYLEQYGTLRLENGTYILYTWDTGALYYLSEQAAEWLMNHCVFQTQAEEAPVLLTEPEPPQPEYERMLIPYPEM